MYFTPLTNLWRILTNHILAKEKAILATLLFLSSLDVTLPISRSIFIYNPTVWSYLTFIYIYIIIHQTKIANVYLVLAN